MGAFVQFRVLVSGRDFILEGKAGVRRVGFFASGMVDAESREEAEQLAVEKARSDLRLHEELGAQMGNLSRLMLERIEELAGSKTSPELLPTRYTFFLQDD